MSKSVEYERIVCQFTYFFKILVLYCGCFTLVKSSTSSGICMYFEIVCQKGTGKPKLAYDVKILKLRWLIRSNTYNIIRSPLATMQRITCNSRNRNRAIITNCYILQSTSIVHSIRRHSIISILTAGRIVKFDSPRDGRREVAA